MASESKLPPPIPKPAPLPTAAPLPVQAPIPTAAPLPGSQLQDNKEDDTTALPIAPLLKFNPNADEVFLSGGAGVQTHGRLWIRGQCIKHGYSRGDAGYPTENTAFCFAPGHYELRPVHYERFKHKSPCIGNISNNYIIGDKALMVETLYNYYGDDAFRDIIPLSFVIEYDYINHKFKLEENKQLCQCIGNTNLKEYEAWIVKASIGFGGQNVYIWSGNDIDELQKFLLIKMDPYKWLDCIHAQYHKIRIVISKYINNPLLYKNKYKFDTRIYVMVAKTNPVIAYYAGMKCRLSTVSYDKTMINDDDESNRLSHITNTYQQVLETDDIETKEDIGLDWPQFLHFMYDVAVKQKKFEKEWFDDNELKQNHHDCYHMEYEEFVSLFENKMKRLCGLCIDAACKDWDKMAIELDRVGQFMMFGVDVLVDDEGKLWLIEVNGKPSIKGGGNDTMKSTLKNLMFEMVDVVHEIREKRLKGINVMKHDHEIASELKYWQPIDLKYYDKHQWESFRTDKLKLRDKPSFFL